MELKRPLRACEFLCEAKLRTPAKRPFAGPEFALSWCLLRTQFRNAPALACVRSKHHVTLACEPIP